jgi:hypothetical protein
MSKIHHPAIVLMAALGLQGLAPVAVSAADLFDGSGLLPMSASTAACQRRGGGARAGAAAQRPPPGNAGRGVRANASPNINHNGNGNRSTNMNANRNVNVNSNRNVNVNVNNDYRGGWDDHYHPIATGVAIGATAAVTAAVVGSVVHSVPPSCSTVVVNGIGYSQCGSTWYAPQYSGTTVQYVVVNPPG